MALLTNTVNLPRKAIRYVRLNVLLGVEPIWRYLMNFVPTLRFLRNRPVLNSEAQRVLEELNRQGVAVSNLEALTGDPTLLGRLQSYAAGLEEAKADRVRAQAEKLGETLVDGYNKHFVVTMFDADRPEIHPDDLVAQISLHEQLKSIADSYYQMRTVVTDINIWRNLVTGPTAVSSQLWHRDLPEDHLILKMFVYIEDVDPGAGPLSYVRGTHGKGNRKWTPSGGVTHDGENWRASDEVMNAATSEEERASVPGKAGTVVFADTFGWHRGGHAKSKPRFVMQTLFASSAALPDRLLGVPSGFDVKTAPAVLKYGRAL